MSTYLDVCVCVFNLFLISHYTVSTIWGLFDFLLLKLESIDGSHRSRSFFRLKCRYLIYRDVFKFAHLLVEEVKILSKS